MNLTKNPNLFFRGGGGGGGGGGREEGGAVESQLTVRDSDTLSEKEKCL